MPFINVNNAVGLLAPDVRVAIGGGAADSVAAVTDANNATYIEQTTAGTSTDWRVTHFLGGAGLGTSPPAGTEIQKIRFAMNCQTGVNQTVKCTIEMFLLDMQVDTGGRVPTNYRSVQTLSLALPGPSVYFVATDWIYYLQDISQPSALGMPLPTTMDQLAYRITADLSIPGSASYASFRVFDCNVQAYWTGIPQVTPAISGDSTSVTWETAPTIQAVRTGVAFPMQSVQAKVFAAADVADETFSPDDSTALWDSGEVLVQSNETAETVWLYPDAPTLPVGKLQAFARASRRAGVPSAPERWGPWTQYDAIPFGNSFGSPRAPKVTLTNQMVASSRVSIDIAGQDSLLSTSHQSGNFAGNSVAFVALNANTNYTVGVSGLGKDNMASFRWFKVTRTGSTGTCGLSTPGTGTTGIPVTAGRTYALCCWAFMNTGASRNLSWDIDWYNSSGTFLSTTSTGTTAVPASPTTTPVLATATVTAPANSAYARYNVKIASVLTTETVYTDGHTFRPYDNTDSNIPSTGGCATGNKVGRDGTSGDATVATTSAIYLDAINGSFDTAGSATAHTGSLADKFTRDTTTQRACWFQFPPFNTRTSFSTQELWRQYPWQLGQFARTTLSGSWWARAVTATRDMRLGIVWFDAMGNVMYIAWGATVNVTTSAYVQLTATGTGPAEAAFCGMRVAIDDGAASEVFVFDDPVLMAGNTGTIRMESFGVMDQLNPDAFLSFAQVQRRINGGDWQDLGWLTTQYDYKQSITSLLDYTCPYGATVDYRARTVVPSGSARVKYGDWSPVVTVSPALAAVGGRWKLKDPLDASRNLDIDLISDRGFEWDRVEDMAVFEPFGRATPIVLADVVRSRTITCTVDIVDSTEYAKFLVLANSQRTLLLQRPWTGEQWWVRITAKVQVIEQSTTPIRYVIEFELREVDVPSVT